MNRPLNRILPRMTGSASVWTWVKWSLLAALVIALAILVRLVMTEIATSRMQAHYLSNSRATSATRSRRARATTSASLRTGRTTSASVIR